MCDSDGARENKQKKSFQTNCLNNILIQFDNTETEKARLPTYSGQNGSKQSETTYSIEYQEWNQGIQNLHHGVTHALFSNDTGKM